jgi:hypothetical protein
LTAPMDSRCCNSVGAASIDEYLSVKTGHE